MRIRLPFPRFLHDYLPQYTERIELVHAGDHAAALLAARFSLFDRHGFDMPITIISAKSHFSEFFDERIPIGEHEVHVFIHNKLRWLPLRRVHHVVFSNDAIFAATLADTAGDYPDQFIP
jgi:hypothetical protein